MFLEAATSGLFLAATYAIAAFGLVIVFGVLDILNFAHGAMLVLSAYLASSLIIGGVPYWVALVGIAAVMALAGMGLERTIFRRSEEHTSELQSLMRISYAVFCLQKKNTQTRYINTLSP